MEEPTTLSFLRGLRNENGMLSKSISKGLIANIFMFDLG